MQMKCYRYLHVFIPYFVFTDSSCFYLELIVTLHRVERRVQEDPGQRRVDDGLGQQSQGPVSSKRFHEDTKKFLCAQARRPTVIFDFNSARYRK